jgi:hypothetical protein
MITFRREEDLIVVTVTNSPAAGEYRIEAPSPEFGRIKDGKLFLGFAGSTKVSVAIESISGLQEAINEARRIRAAKIAARGPATVTCSRCHLDLAAPEAVWVRRRGRNYSDSYCEHCARLLRIVGGGRGADDEEID